MMGSFKTYSRPDVLAYVKFRDGETKLGQQVAVLQEDQKLESSSARFVLLGIPEDIGIAANYGVRGAATAWEATLKSLLNTQSNVFLPGDELLVLGHFEFDFTKSASPEELMEQVAQIDDQVYPLIMRIINAGKIPIVIGGGHNNAYPIIKGCAVALGKKINVANIDAHADLRTADGRHSGNGFSYGLRNDYLSQYRVFGLQQNYLNAYMLEIINANSKIKAKYLEELLLVDDIAASFSEFVADIAAPFGLEIDLDAITGILASAATPSGIPLNTLRKILLRLRAGLTYLHICEGASTMDDGRTDPATGKTISYLITDFIKAQQAKH